MFNPHTDSLWAKEVKVVPYPKEDGGGNFGKLCLIFLDAITSCTLDDKNYLQY